MDRFLPLLLQRREALMKMKMKMKTKMKIPQNPLMRPRSQPLSLSNAGN